ncbi:uncharacterized protein B0T15DRAFT_243329 [Chaetomium strumarium]|uniref:Uncharacterized protein n=1 Tax=Chaetomium strumarium TaxID=1170767 RepID=A0AAJ0GQV9_9PEZI|nr:hypothetical protein B0T15DRAFT_243329 [Chaetomium strumarium]
MVRAPGLIRTTDLLGCLRSWFKVRFTQDNTDTGQAWLAWLTSIEPTVASYIGQVCKSPESSHTIYVVFCRRDFGSLAPLFLSGEPLCHRDAKTPSGKSTSRSCEAMPRAFYLTTVCCYLPFMSPTMWFWVFAPLELKLGTVVKIWRWVG